MRAVLLIIGVLVSLAAGHLAYVENSEGIIEFEAKINLHRTLPEDRQKVKSMIPEFRTTRHQLLFRGTESLYKPVEEDIDEDPDFSNGEGMRVQFRQPHVEVYFDHASSKRITQREFMGKEYLIEDSLKMPPWKFGTETKTVMGFNCRQAMYHDEEQKQEVVAWYTPELRPFLGPDNFNTLPGAVLEVDINNGERVISAINFDKRPLKRNAIKVPVRGAKVTHEEFKKLVHEQVQNRRTNGANVIIR